MNLSCDKHLYAAKCSVCDRGPDIEFNAGKARIRYIRRQYVFNGIRWAPVERDSLFHQFEILIRPPFAEYSFVTIPADGSGFTK